MLELQQILEKLSKLEGEVKEIKKQMADIDSVMTEDDYKALLDYRKEKSEKKLVSHEHLKKELGF